MSDADYQMDEAIRLYSEESTFAEIATALEVSKSYAQKLVRLGIAKTLDKLGNEKLLEMVDNDKEPENEAKLGLLPEDETVIQPQPMATHQPQLIPPQSMAKPQPLPPIPEAPSEYSFELVTAIGKQINVSFNELGIYDTARSAGYDGDFSDLIRESLHFWFAHTNLVRRSV